MNVPTRNSHMRVQARPRWVSGRLRLFPIPPRRRVRVSDVLAGVLIVLAGTAVFLLIVALGLGSAWLIIAIVQDLAHRLGG